MLISIDIGNGNIKAITDTQKVIVPATLDHGESILNNELIDVKFNDSSYTIGRINSPRRRDYAKYTTDYHKIMLMGTIAYLMEDLGTVSVDLVLGLPIEYYKNHYMEYCQLIKSYGTQSIFYKKPREIKIENVVVFPQSALTFKDDINGYTLVIDLGEGTLDVSFWDNRTLLKAKSYTLGCTDLYEQLANAINGMDTSYNVEPFLIEKSMIVNPNITSINIIGKSVDITQIKSRVMREFTESIISKISMDFSQYSIIDNIYLAGGGAVYTAPYLKKYYSNLKVEHNTFFNAEIFYKIGGDTFNGTK